MKKNYYIILLLALTVIISVYFAPFLLHLKDIEYRMYLSEKLNSLGLKGIIALISFFALQLAIPFLPGEPLEIISGAIYGPILGLLYAQIGIFIGSYIVISLIRGLNLKVKKINKYKWLRNILDDPKRLNITVFSITLIPGFPKDIIPFFVSQTIMKKKDYFLINFIARIPSILSSTLIGSSLFHGNIWLGIFIFIIEFIIGILGLIFNKKIVQILTKKHRKEKSSNTKVERMESMSEIKCSALKCGYNENNTCHKKNIKVEGLFSRSKLGTFCQSFRNPIDETLFKEEIADEMSLDEHKVKTGCTANYCIYNKDNYCKASKITVGQKNAKYRSETQCDSFELK